MAKISTKNIARTIYELTRDKQGQELELVLVKITKYLAEKRLLSKAGEILEKLEEIINKEEGIVPVDITFKKIPDKKITEEIEELLKKRYQAKKILTTVKEDKDILGGVKIEGQGEVIDLTYRNKIKQLQNYLITN